MSGNVKQLSTVLYSLPVAETLNLPPRAELLPKIESGELEHLDFRAGVFIAGENANSFVFNEADLPAFAASFEGQPYLRNHDKYDIAARDGTILRSVLEGKTFIQDIRLTTRVGMTDFVEGRMDRFSIGIGYDEIVCTICNSSWLSYSCPHSPGRKYQTATGEQTCQLLFINPRGTETSAVNYPAVNGTGIVAALETKLEALRLEKVPTYEPDGQAPVEDLSHLARAQARQERLNGADTNLTINQGASQMKNVRELLKKRAECLTAARALHELAENETRDLSETERADFGRLMAEAEGFEAQIKTLQVEHEQLLNAEASLSGLSTDPIKPEGANASKLLKRAEFDALSVTERANFVRSGGKVED